MSLIIESSFIIQKGVSPMKEVLINKGLINKKGIKGRLYDSIVLCVY